MLQLPRYRLGARFYDVLSLERLLYRSGRLCALELAQIEPGDRVLDLGCGTGLSFAPVVAAVGESGVVVGVDSSAAMLARAQRRVRRHGWRQVELMRSDAGTLPEGLFDVIVFAYSLSVVNDWQSVWTQALARLAPHGRIAVIDTAYPSGYARVFAPLAWIYLAAGGVHPGRRVWHAVERDTVDVRRRSLLAGHVRLAVGRKRP